MRYPPESIERPSYSPMTVGCSSSLDTCMEHSPFVGGDRRRGAATRDEKQQRGRAEDRGADARGEQRRPRAEGAHHDAAEHERAELGAIAGAVVRGESTTTQRL